jgi:hypothetical protein
MSLGSNLVPRAARAAAGDSEIPKAALQPWRAIGEKLNYQIEKLNGAPPGRR